MGLGVGDSVNTAPRPITACCDTAIIFLLLSRAMLCTGPIAELELCNRRRNELPDPATVSMTPSKTIRTLALPLSAIANMTLFSVMKARTQAGAESRAAVACPPSPMNPELLHEPEEKYILRTKFLISLTEN